ncbi:MAG: head completion/stabilization protein [Gammaproteobacteria bacterium]|nr:head completion/stabilization protein [Gammaproteobacteria bacterium]
MSDTPDTAKRTLPNNGFWPDIDPGQPPRQHYLVIDAFSEGPLLENALIEAMTPVNKALMPWQAKREQAGYPNLAAVFVPVWQDENAYLRLYHRALFSTAYAKLLEAHPDTDISPLNIDSAKAADGYWRDATWAVSELLGEQVEVGVLAAVK